MGMIGEGLTEEEAHIIGRAWQIENNLRNTSYTVKKIDDGWSVRYEVWE